MHYGDLVPICFLYCPTTLKAWQALYLRDIYEVIRMCFFGVFQTFFFDVFLDSVEYTQIHFLVENVHLFGHFREPLGSLRGTFGRLLVTKVAQRLQKVSQKRPNGPKAPQKGSEKTIWLAFLNKFDVFSTTFLFSLVLASIWLLLAPIGSSWLLLPSICSYCFRFSPIASSLLLLSPIGS